MAKIRRSWAESWLPGQRSNNRDYDNRLGVQHRRVTVLISSTNRMRILSAHKHLYVLSLVVPELPRFEIGCAVEIIVSPTMLLCSNTGGGRMNEVSQQCNASRCAHLKGRFGFMRSKQTQTILFCKTQKRWRNYRRSPISKGVNDVNLLTPTS